MENKEYDVVIIGAGITGTAILYALSKYTNVDNIALLEKYDKIAAVQSSKNNNSQTLHFGDIESHYTPKKAIVVKEAAELVAAYVEKKGRQLYNKFHKMVLAVGEQEVKTLRERQIEFKKIFPKLRLINREELTKVEPKLTEGRDPTMPILAAYTPEGFAINFGALAESFVKDSKGTKKSINIFMNTKVNSITNNNGFRIKTNNGEFKAKVLMVAASASSLTFAHKLGYGKDLIILPVSGDFFCSKKQLNGKVYMMQNPKLPFAAIHGDPDVMNPNETRFGPIAKVLPILEKRNILSAFDFLKLFRFKFSAITSIIKILSDPVYYRYVFWNVLYGLPFLGKYFFLREVRKIIPSIKGNELHYGRELGGIRPQVVDTKTKKITMGEAKILGENCIFNITPSPGASVCLMNAKNDVKKIIEFLGKDYNFEQDKFMQDHKRGN
jgi:malate dehydrogenase (quinone)